MNDVSCQVGNTPEVEIEGIIFKRDDMNPSGSVKDRGIAYQLDWVKKQGIKDLVISSSGNAAISACYFCKRLELNLFVFVSPKINHKKLDILHQYPFQVFINKRAKSESIKFAKRNNFFHLRSSADPRGTIGYQEIAKEILEDRGNQGGWGQINSIFIPVSSGTTLVGINEGFGRQGFLPQIHAVQTTAINSIARLFDRDFRPSKTSLADSLVARTTPRRKQLIGIITKSKGFGWVIANDEIIEASQWLEGRKLLTSFEGAAALAGIWKARKKNWQLGKVVCLLTGKRYI